MNKQLWVKLVDRDRYSNVNNEKWQLGTVVGEQILSRLRDQVTLEQQLFSSGYKEKRYLVEIASGVVEAWASDTYEPQEQETK